MEEKKKNKQTSKNKKPKKPNGRVFDHVKFWSQLSFKTQVLVDFGYQLMKGNKDKLLRALQWLPKTKLNQIPFYLRTDQKIFLPI